MSDTQSDTKQGRIWLQLKEPYGALFRGCCNDKLNKHLGLKCSLHTSTTCFYSTCDSSAQYLISERWCAPREIGCYFWPLSIADTHLCVEEPMREHAGTFSLIISQSFPKTEKTTVSVRTSAPLIL